MTIETATTVPAAEAEASSVTATGSAEPDITLYSYGLPNGHKISIALEELGLPYKVVPIDISTLEQKQPWYLSINPNGRIPALTDASYPSGAPLHIFESGAILQYLATRYDPEYKISFPPDTREHWEMTQWLFFQTSGIGPMQGQLIHFTYLSTEPIPYAHQRYYYEVKRLYQVLDTRLKGREFLVGDHVSIADITTWGWVWSSRMVGIDLNEFPEVKRWEEALGKRRAFVEGLKKPEARFNFATMTMEESKKLGDRAREWVQNGMRHDRESLIEREKAVREAAEAKAQEQAVAAEAV